ncbi:MAG: NGG1p interacting factor NIF3 [bacterium]
MYKLTVYIPEAHVEPVKAALFAAGAGRYARYDCCAWQVLGQGQFRALAGSQPFVGAIGRVEQVAEYRVEMVVQDDVVPAVLEALKAAHPYEEPAFDLVEISLCAKRPA